jgi:phosphomevalonate kinase
LERTWSAAGKLFLAGEYAVLWGGVARVLAAGPRLQALVRRREDRAVAVSVEDAVLRGTATPAGVRWDGEVPARLAFVARTLDLALRAGGTESTGLSLALESSPLHCGHKLGFGGSARAVVLTAEAARFALGGTFGALKLALLAHSNAQGGQGSGADVAACFAGGVVRVRRFDVGALARAAVSGGLPSALACAGPVDLERAPPPNLPLLYAFSGESASTPALVAEVERRLAGPSERQRLVERSDSAGEALELALARGRFDGVAEAFEELQGLLNSLAPARSEGLSRILRIAQSLGCAGKQSGAGGGDCAVLAAPDGAAAMLALDTLKARGIPCGRLSPEPGLRGEPEAPPVLRAWIDAI